MPKQKMIDDQLPETHEKAETVNLPKKRGPKPKDSVVVEPINTESMIDLSEKKTIKIAKGISELIDRCPKISNSEVKAIYPEATGGLINEARFWSKVI